MSFFTRRLPSWSDIKKWDTKKLLVCITNSSWRLLPRKSFRLSARTRDYSPNDFRISLRGNFCSSFLYCSQDYPFTFSVVSKDEGKFRVIRFKAYEHALVSQMFKISWLYRRNQTVLPPMWVEFKYLRDTYFHLSIHRKIKKKEFQRSTLRKNMLRLCLFFVPPPVFHGWCLHTTSATIFGLLVWYLLWSSYFLFCFSWFYDTVESCLWFPRRVICVCGGTRPPGQCVFPSPQDLLVHKAMMFA